MPNTYYTNNYNAQKETRANPARLADANVASGSVEFAVVPYPVVALAVGDVIFVGLIPAGSIPVPQLSDVTSTASVGSVQLDLGTAEDPDGWAKSITLAAGKVAATAGTSPAWLAPTKLAADAGSGNVAVYATVATGSASVGATLYFTLAYKRNR